MSTKAALLDEEDDFIEVGVADEDVDLQIEDDTPEEDRGKPIAEAASQDDEEDSDMAEHSAKVQARMRKITAQKHDERRAKEVALREKETALEYVRRLTAENERLAKQASASNQMSIAAIKSQATQELASIKEDLRAAYELGDGGKAAELTEKLQEAKFKLMSANAAEEQQKSQAAVVDQPVITQPQAPKLSDRQRSWLEKNKWFEENPVMRAMALGVHHKLYNDGVALESDTYYNAINAEVRKRFPEEFKSSNSDSRTSSPQVAAVSRLSGGGAKKPVKLSTSEVSIAKQLGISPIEYARQKMILEASQ